MKIVSEKQLTFIRTEYQDLINQQSSNYFFEGSDRSLFDNLIVFTDDLVFSTIRKDHYLSMTNCQRVWNKYFWYLRYQSHLKNNGQNTDNHIQPISKVLEELYQTCDNIDDNYIESFVNFASDFEKQAYITFDYFHPAITDTGVSLKSEELTEIVRILKIEKFSFEEIERLIEKNIDNRKAELLTYKNHIDNLTYIKVDTFSAREDQIHSIDIVIKCKFEYKEQIDNLLLSWWTKFWKKMGPFVAITTEDKFDTKEYFKGRVRIEK